MLAFSAGSALFVMPLLAFAQTGSSPAEATRKFREYLDEDWKRWMQEYPETATSAGFPGQNRRWSDDSREGIEARIRHLHESFAKLKSISRDALPAGEQLNYDLYRERLETVEEGLQYGDDPMPFHGVVPHSLWMPMTQMGGIQQGMPATLATMPHQTVTDYQDILARLEALPKNVEQNIELLREGLKRGYSPPKLMLRDVPKQIAGLIPADALASPLLEPFSKFPAGFPESEKARLTERAKQLYSGVVVPAIQKLHDYVAKTYIPACRESIAATALPNGAAAYAFHVRWQTTTNLTPQQIHEIGLSEVKRIRAEMDKVIASTGFKGSFHDFTEFLRTDPRFFYDQTDDLVNGYRIITKKIDPELAHLFGKLPRLPYGVCVIPDFKAPSQTTAYYQPGAPSAGRPGCYFVNTYNLRARPKWEMEALSLHESVPGHHLQISLAQEQEGQPEFRKHSGYSAFVEGWALYSESLGEDVGLYKDPYSKFGQLSYEMWRAVRLVVDTGMHSMGWTRQQAIDFFRENTGKTDQDITVEVDRYIVWPGQALAYKIGQLKIRELRTEAEKKLSAKFDVRKFHDAALENGAVPLSVLEAHMKQWMDSQAAH
ncbi:MAG: hypothetical protein AUH11_02325 [Acidobacteria bacterium 13_2_20CM_57_17]|nr:MAG: hypothetical protein AUH11_02325 [Acidobacteria bacterium 13_2_20CM_57_17]OLE15979.1 MAG: hypothetical protein AUG83_04900 [Acidobacteria bacterium 13_1_20CM_4_57_11]